MLRHVFDDAAAPPHVLGAACVRGGALLILHRTKGRYRTSVYDAMAGTVTHPDVRRLRSPPALPPPGPTVVFGCGVVGSTPRRAVVRVGRESMVYWRGRSLCPDDLRWPSWSPLAELSIDARTGRPGPMTVSESGDTLLRTRHLSTRGAGVHHFDWLACPWGEGWLTTAESGAVYWTTDGVTGDRTVVVGCATGVVVLQALVNSPPSSTFVLDESPALREIALVSTLNGEMRLHRLCVRTGLEKSVMAFGRTANGFAVGGYASDGCTVAVLTVSAAAVPTLTVIDLE